MAVPVEPRLHRPQAPLPGPQGLPLPRARRQGSAGGHFESAGLARLPDMPHRERAEGEVRAQPRTGGGRGDGAADAAGIAPAAASQKIVQHVVGGPLATALAVLSVGRQAQVAAAEDAGGLESLDGVAAATAPGPRYGSLRALHAFFPKTVPAVSRAEPPHDAGLRQLQKLDAGRAGPAPHAAVAGVGHARAGLLVGHEPCEAGLLTQPLEHRDSLAPAGHKPDAEAAERGLEVAQALLLEGCVAGVPFRLGEDFGLVEEHREHGPAPRPLDRCGERRVVRHAEIALEPDADRRGGVHWATDGSRTRSRAALTIGRGGRGGTGESTRSAPRGCPGSP